MVHTLVPLLNSNANTYAKGIRLRRQLTRASSWPRIPRSAALDLTVLIQRWSTFHITHHANCQSWQARVRFNLLRRALLRNGFSLLLRYRKYWIWQCHIRYFPASRNPLIIANSIRFCYMLFRLYNDYFAEIKVYMTYITCARLSNMDDENALTVCVYFDRKTTRTTHDVTRHS